MKISSEIQHGIAVLRPTGTFDMEACAHFHNASRQVLEADDVSAVEVDMSAVDVIDSSALGMLLLLQRNAEQRGWRISLRGCQPFVLRVLTTANFQQLFKIA